MDNKSWYYFLLFVILSNSLYSQVDSLFVDDKYLEDQIFINLTYNYLYDRPSGLSQSGISGGIALGFIKDLPINKRRNKAIAVGLGYAYNAYNQNLEINPNGDFNILSGVDYYTNRLITNSIEIPIEYRWRTSTATVYKFWRIYSGVKLNYVFSHNSKFSSATDDYNNRSIDELNKFQYGLYVSAGYSTFNLHLYYGLNDLFNNATLTSGESIDLRQFNFGLSFYIL